MAQPRTDAEQNDTRHCGTGCEDKIAEILVLGKKNSILAQRPNPKIGIRRLSGGFGNAEDIVTGFTELQDNAVMHALVCEPAHGEAIPPPEASYIPRRKRERPPGRHH